MSQMSCPHMLTFDTAVYRLSALKKAAYKFSGRYLVSVALTGEKQATISVSCNDPAIDLQSVLHDIHREVTDQELRELILEETAGVRNLLMAQAFSATSLIETNVDTQDYLADPLGITAPDVTPSRQPRS